MTSILFLVSIPKEAIISRIDTGYLNTMWNRSLPTDLSDFDATKSTTIQLLDMASTSLHKQNKKKTGLERYKEELKKSTEFFVHNSNIVGLLKQLELRIAQLEEEVKLDMEGKAEFEGRLHILNVSF